MSAAVIVFDNVSRWYGEVIALNGTSFEIGPGVTGLLGPNGSGKTTMLRLITGLLKPNMGTVSVFGVDPWEDPELFRRMGVVPDAETLYDNMTGFGFLEFASRLAGYDSTEAGRRAETALERMALSTDGARRIGGYSKGMRQRLKLAQALIHEPELLILDEPLSGMDPVGRRRTIELVRQWGESDGTVLVSSHILHEVEAMTKNILLIQDGRIRADGDVREIRDLINRKPHHIAVRCAEPRVVGRELLGWEFVDAVGVAPGALILETRSPHEVYKTLPPFLQDKGIKVDEISATDQSLDAVFEYLTG